MKRFLVTGANGFVGQALCKQLLAQHIKVVQIVRKLDGSAKQLEKIAIDINSSTDWSSALKEVDVVIHLAARVHVMRDLANDPQAAFYETNCLASVNLAKQAAAAGVKRFVYVSSVKVNGEHTQNHRFTEQDAPNPQDAYATSKWQAEQALWQLAQATRMEIVVIRPPLVYGAGVKANFLSLINLTRQPIPLPLGRINNRRSLIYLENLTDFIMLCAHHPKAANQTFLISDDDDISTTQLIRYIKAATGGKALLLPVPQSWLVGLLKLMGKSSMAEKICANLQVDITKAKTLLGWQPPYGVKAGIAKIIGGG